MKNIVIIGSTGSIGTQALRVIQTNADKLRVLALACHRNTELLAQQAVEFGAQYTCVVAEDATPLLPVEGRTDMVGSEGLQYIATLPTADTILVAGTGITALPAVVAALRAGKTVAMATKEIMVTGGDILNKVLDENPHARILPVDSEHNAVFRLLEGVQREHISGVYLTASGGAFRDKTPEELLEVTPEEALRHPNWVMGQKVTVDCATLLNKGLEVIEAMQLFRLPRDMVKVIMHRESTVHALVSFTDGSFSCSMSAPSMLYPISYALLYPDMAQVAAPALSLDGLTLGFSAPDTTRYPMLELAYTVATEGGTLPLVLCAADEVAVEAFLGNKIGFLDIYYYVNKTVEHYEAEEVVSVEQLLALEKRVKSYTRRLIGE